ncbi:MAG: PilZ domain-containing protein [Phycisphaeraceae bacterium]
MPKYADEQWRKMLAGLSGRDAPVELSRRSANDDGPPIVYHSRLFEVEPDGSIIVERPAQAMRDKSFGTGDDIELLLMHNGDRLVATTTIRNTHVRQINKATRVTCYKLSPGRRPQREQRRAFYRVNVAGAALEPVVLRIDPPTKTEAADSQPKPEEPLEVQGKLVNLSGGGFGVSVSAKRELLNKIKRTRDMHVAVRFDEGHAMDVPVHVAHLGARGDDLLYLGLEVKLDDDNQARAVQDELLHLCARFQRAQLQRRKA